MLQKALDTVRSGLKTLGAYLLPVVLTTVAISLLSFRQIFSNDVFHVVVLSSVILPFVKVELARLKFENSNSGSKDQ